MIEKKTAITHSSPTKAAQNVNTSSHPGPVQTPGTSGFFYRENYIWMLAGLVVIAIGMFLMSGGKSNDPNVFDQKEVYSTTRITIAPILILIGLGLEVFAIFRRPAPNAAPKN